MRARTAQLTVCALLALAGLGGIYLQIDYSGWVLFVGLLAFIDRV